MKVKKLIIKSKYFNIGKNIDLSHGTMSIRANIFVSMSGIVLSMNPVDISIHCSEDYTGVALTGKNAAYAVVIVNGEIKTGKGS